MRIMILTIQVQKVAEISEAVMRMMGQDLVENATLFWNHRQRGFKGLQDLWLILRITVQGNFPTSLRVGLYLSSYFQVLTFTSHHLQLLLGVLLLSGWRGLTSKKLEAICGGNSYQEIKVINQIMALCNNNSSTL